MQPNQVVPPSSNVAPPLVSARTGIGRGRLSNRGPIQSESSIVAQWSAGTDALALLRSSAAVVGGRR